ncbi:hypothetical protein CsSME_00051942 [Camellia sinensis var. sinensis]
MFLNSYKSTPPSLAMFCGLNPGFNGCRSMLISSPITDMSSGSVVAGLKMESGASASTSGSSMKKAPSVQKIFTEWDINIPHLNYDGTDLTYYDVHRLSQNFLKASCSGLAMARCCPIEEINTQNEKNKILLNKEEEEEEEGDEIGLAWKIDSSGQVKFRSCKFAAVVPIMN